MFRTQRFIFTFVLLCIGCVLGSQCLLAAGKTPVDWRPGFLSSVGIVPTSGAAGPQTFMFVAETGADGARSVTDAHAMRRIGGIVFVEEASPGASTLNQCPRVTYSMAAKNGHRLLVDFGALGGVLTGTIYDWELLPTARFVKSGAHGLFTYMKSHAEYHPDFYGNLAGVNLFFVDGTRAIPAFETVHLGLNKSDIPGYPATPATALSKKAALDLQDQLGFEHLMFTDKDVHFTFSKSPAGVLTISGSPYWIALEKNADGSGRVVRRVNISLPLRANSVVYSSVERIAQYSAFFRYLQHHCDSEWQAFLQDLENHSIEIDVLHFSNVPSVIDDGYQLQRYFERVSQERTRH